MRPFEGFQRKAIVIVPTDEEFKRRCEQREKEEGKDVPDSAVLEMKGGSALTQKTETPQRAFKCHVQTIPIFVLSHCCV